MFHVFQHSNCLIDGPDVISHYCQAQIERSATLKARNRKLAAQVDENHEIFTAYLQLRRWSVVKDLQLGGETAWDSMRQHAYACMHYVSGQWQCFRANIGDWLSCVNIFSLLLEQVMRRHAWYTHGITNSQIFPTLWTKCHSDQISRIA